MTQGGKTPKPSASDSVVRSDAATSEERSLIVRKRRLPPAMRRHEIVDRAAQFFAERGFAESTRELAAYLNVTQPLLYRYFPTKDALIMAVFQSVFLDVWRPHWDEMLADRSKSLADRLRAFYADYTDAIMTERWMRIYFFAALRGAEINKLYIAFIERKILATVAVEILAENGLETTKVLIASEIERAWVLQSAIFYYGVRKFVYQLEPSIGKGEAIEDAVRIFLAGYPTSLGARGLLPETS